MASLAEMVAGNAIEQAEKPGPSASLLQGYHQGAQLAMQQEKLQNEHAQLQQKAQEFQVAKWEKAGKLFDMYGKMPEGPAKKTFGTKVIPANLSVMGMSQEMNPAVADMMQTDPELGVFLQAKISDGTLKLPDVIAATKDSEKFAALATANGWSTWADQQLLAGTVEKNSKGLVTAQKEALDRASREKVGADRGAPMNNRTDAQMHNTALKGISTSDPQIKPLIQSYQNLQNAVRNFKEGGSTPNELSELQGTVNSNLGIKGTTSAHERADRMAKSTGIEASKWYMFFTGDTEGIANVMKTSPKLAEQVLKIADLEMENKKKQAQDVMDSNSSGYDESLYSRRPDMKNDFEKRKQKTMDVFNGVPSSGSVTVGSKSYPRKVLEDYVAKHPDAPDAAAAKKALGMK